MDCCTHSFLDFKLQLEADFGEAQSGMAELIFDRRLGVQPDPEDGTRGVVGIDYRLA